MLPCIDCIYQFVMPTNYVWVDVSQHESHGKTQKEILTFEMAFVFVAHAVLLNVN